MPRVNKDDLIKRISAKLGTDEDDLSILEDIADSMDPVDVTEYTTRIETLEKEKQEIEDTWKAKYKARFTEPAPVPVENVTAVDVDVAEGNTEETESIEDLAERIKI